MAVPVILSTATVLPDGVETAFAVARDLGFDGVEVMVLSDDSSRDEHEIRDLMQAYQLPVPAIHAPTLLLTQRVWGTPWEKIDRSVGLARAVGASTVVMHPPFRWQVRYLRDFVHGVIARELESGIMLSVENMFPWRFGKAFEIYRPDWDPTDDPYPSVTLDISHAATSRSDPLAMARRLGGRLAHLHLADGNGSFRDQHLPPGWGIQPCDVLLRYLADTGFDGAVSLEVNTRGYRMARRDEILGESLTFARRHLGMADRPGGARSAG